MVSQSSQPGQVVQNPKSNSWFCDSDKYWSKSFFPKFNYSRWFHPEIEHIWLWTHLWLRMTGQQAVEDRDYTGNIFLWRDKSQELITAFFSSFSDSNIHAWIADKTGLFQESWQEYLTMFNNQTMDGWHLSQMVKSWTNPWQRLISHLVPCCQVRDPV